MGNTNLYKVENTLRSIAKRYKSVKYSLGLAILFLMMGVSAFSEDITPQAQVLSREEIASSKDNLKGSIGNLQSKIDTAKKENEKGLNGLRLELIQLMEQGNQVVKSPWASWQFGANYIYNDWQSSYKGRGDKAKLYPYYGRYGMSNNIYENVVSPTSNKYSSLSKGANITSSVSTQRANLGSGFSNSYGLVGVQPTQEQPQGFNVSAAIRPKQVQKGAITIADKTPVTPTQPETIVFDAPVINVIPPTPPVISPATPNINPPTVSPAALANPSLPTALSFAMASPTIVVPTLTTPSVTIPNPPGTGNGDEMFIYDGKSSALAGTLSGYDVGVIAQYSTNGGTMDVDVLPTGGNFTFSISGGGTVNSGLTSIRTNGVTFTGHLGPSHNGGSSYSSNLNIVNSSSLSAMKLVGGHRVDINNTTINFRGTGTYQKWLFHTDGHNDYGDSTWVIGNGTKINISGNKLIMYTAQYHGSAPTRGSVGMVNNGTITTAKGSGDTENYIWASLSAGSWGGDRVMYFRNAGTITLNGTKDAFAVMNSETSGTVAVINDGTIKLAGDKQTGITFGQSYARSEILLNKPLTITGTNSTGVYFNYQVDLEGNLSRGTSFASNIVTAFPSQTRASILKVDIDSKTAVGNAGLFFNSTGSQFNMFKSELNLKNGKNNAGIYANNGAVNIKKLTSGNENKINLTGGESNIGIYANGTTATSATVSAGGEINIIGGKNNIGILSVKATAQNTGDINVKYKNSVGAVATSTDGIFRNTIDSSNNKGKITVDTTNAVGVAAVTNGKAYIDNGTVSAKGTATAALYATKAGKVFVGSKADVVAANGGINAYAAAAGAGATNAGNIEINGGGNTVLTTNSGGLTFMADSVGSAKIDITGSTKAQINTRGSVFYFPPASVPSTPTYTPFNVNQFKAYVQNHFAHLNNLTLNMATGSNLAVASYVEANTAGTNLNSSTAFGSAGTPNITGSDYNSLLLYRSRLTVDKDSNLDSTSTGIAAAFRKTALASSAIINNSKITGTQASKIAMAQEDQSTNPVWVKLTNSKNASISLSGKGSVAMYASNGTITNAGTITMGKAGVALYGHNNKYGDSNITNTGKISLGSQAIGIYARDYNKKGIVNNGTITFTADKGVGMLYVPKNLTVSTIVENKGTINQIGTGGANIAMYGKPSANNKAYTLKNSGTINLSGVATSLSNPTIGMYTEATAVGRTPLVNAGTITVGKFGIGMFGFEATSTKNITVGDSGIGIFTKGGNVTVSNSNIKVGNNSAIGIYNTGSGQTITSSNMKYTVGDKSYGFINRGAGNTINITGGSASLGNEGVFVYSSDITGKITNKAAITSTGTTGKNYGIYATGLVNNSGTITLNKGNGNVGIFAMNGANITNTGAINLGASTNTNRSIGAIASAGTVNNSGAITVNGKYGLGLYGNKSGGVNGTINNSSAIKVIGDETIGAYANAASDINLNAGSITANGNQSTGYYLSSGNNSRINSGVKIAVAGNKANGIFVNGPSGRLDYKGDTTVKGDAAYGMIIDGNSTINATSGKVTISGASGNSSNVITGTGGRGAAGLVVMQGSKLTGNGLTVNANVSGANSVGIYSKGNLEMKSADIKAYNGAVNFFADQNGTISIGNNGGTVTAVTGSGTNTGSLLFYTPGGKVLINGNMTATIQGGSKPTNRATAFYYTGSGTLGNIGTYTALSPANVATWARNSYGNGTTSTLGKLTLNMQANSRLFLTQKVNMNLSNTSVTNLFSGLSASEKPTVNGSGYRSFMLYQSHLNVDKAVNLDNANDNYNQVEVSNSSITNNNTMTGTKTNQIAIAQENSSATAPKTTVTLTNNGTINLSGANSAAVYAKNGIVNNTNTGKITVGDKSTGLYGLSNTKISNAGNISVGNSSTGMFYSDIYKDSKSKTTVYSTVNGLKNDGNITLRGDNGVGMTYEPGNLSGARVFENAGTIAGTKDKNVGMYAKVAKNGVGYSTVNSKTITLGNSASMSNPNVAMYTNATTRGTNPLINNGNITVGKNSVGLYGFEETNTGNITVGDASVAMYSKGGNITLNGGTITTGAKEAVGVYTVGNGQTVVNNSTTFNLGNTSFGFVNVGRGNTIQSKVANAKVGNETVYIYSKNNGTIVNNTNITSNGTKGLNYGIYAAGNITNTGNMNFSTGKGNVGIYVINNGTARNTGTISIGGSDASNEIYGVGMAAGYIGDKSTPATSGTIVNAGTINVNGAHSIGMYGVGAGTTVTNNGNINLNANNTIGIYVEEGAKAVNNGVIRTGASGLKNTTGIVLGRGSRLVNNNLIDIDATGGVGVYFKGGIIVNEGTINVRGAGARKTFRLNQSATTKGVGRVKIDAPAGSQTATITDNGVVVRPTIVTTTAQKPVSVSASSIGLYVNTSGKTYTNAINNLGALTSEADLIIGAEAAESTLSKYIQINDSKILGSYNNAISNGGVSKWNIYAGSLTWMSTPTLDPDTGAIKNLYMAKIPYTEWASNSKPTPIDKKDTYNFTDGLEQRYGIKELGSRENQVFQKLNSIGNNQEILLYQAFDEMMGHQYANVQQRIQATGNILDKEFNYLRSEWQTASKDSNKIKTFGTRGEYNSDSAGIIDYKYNAYGVAYVHENEDIKLGRGIGWYSGIAQNTIKFKDIGKSKEEQLQAKVGIFKSVPFDDNNSLNWTISGNIFAGYNKMNRKFLVVDDIFNAKGKYYNYGIGLRNEIGKAFRLSESFSLRPYVGLGLEYGRVSKIREKSGEVKLEVKQKDYISVKPEVGTELAYKHYFGAKTLRAGLGVAYENELGRVANGKNKARVSDTTADWFNIRGEKEDRKGNVKFDLNLGLDNQRYGVTANVGYDTKGENIRGGLGLRIIF